MECQVLKLIKIEGEQSGWYQCEDPAYGAGGYLWYFRG
jgi:hypothetical protein